MTSAIWWIGRDLRLGDNPALWEAQQAGEQVIPLFIIDPRLTEVEPRPEKRLDFLWGGLQALDESLRRLGSRLIVRRGNPAKTLAEICQETGAEAIYAQADYTPFAKRRDQEITGQLPLQLVEGLTVMPPGSVLKADGQPYTIFTPFSKNWKSFPHPTAEVIFPRPEKIDTPTELKSLPIPPISAKEASRTFPPGEVEAHRRLKAFTRSEDVPIWRYADERNRPDLPGTSTLSPYLRFGMLSARQAMVAGHEALQQARDEQARKGAQTWLNELIWREFFIAIMHHFPHVKKVSFRPELRDIPWRNDQTEFKAWKTGQTGYPIVDAAMRQLAETGWMHNRARMIVASFLVKDLLIDWRWGESWFMQHLVDGDPAANNGGWQWSAGTGTDAAPYFRIFNPILQGKKFDPQGDYVRCWVPELAEAPQKFIHTPWEIPTQLQSQIGCRLGIEYPLPIVDHSMARERTLEAYRLAKESQGSR